ncbi:allantoate amidohydrolase [Thermoflavimicrobium daqui]|uniref:Allantoate amidohydrolase n=1 Tax=Thermoflavimicrobium daqui TaxID=2137476 RepID=A0A364K7D6_9BACL|nr:allantoate amidohydrolase [Thermoflavimicrobium daqui]RAL26209.1 allantoate amidohydrolase [Thermoflavimicrobium daqui]
MQNLIQPNAERMVSRIESLAKYSRSKRGVTRLSFSEESEQVNQLVSEWMQEAGMSVRRDAVNNLIGRYEGTDPTAPVLLIGSHLDTVIEAGKYDGILGVITGLEVVQTLFENNLRLPFPIEVIGFCDEEGTRFHTTLLGSRAIAGTLTSEDLSACDSDGLSLSEAMKRIGLEPTHFKQAAKDPKSILGYLEVHIEQGPVLEKLNQACGVVAGIAGATRYEFCVEGEAGHAGTVPHILRKDALTGAAEMILAVEEIAQQMESLVATVGKLEVYPGASNVIPGQVKGTLDIRSINNRVKHQAFHQILSTWEEICKGRDLTLKLKKVMDSPAVSCSSKWIERIGNALENHAMKRVVIPSGAGHDAMAIAEIAPIGMIFVRCRKGISHHPDEYCSPEDMQMGATILLDVVMQINS